MFWARPVDELVALYVGLQEYMRAPMERVIATQVLKGKSLVIEGTWISPSFASAGAFHDVETEVRSVFLFEPDSSELERRRHQRTYPWMRTFADDVMQNVAAMRYAHSVEMKQRAEALGLPVLESRPFETLESRALAVLGLDDRA